MPTNEERRYVANKLNNLVKTAEPGTEEWTIYSAMVEIDNYLSKNGIKSEFIEFFEPDKGIDFHELQDACFGLIEGASDPDYSLYQTIFDAIYLWKQGKGYFGVYYHDQKPEPEKNFKWQPITETEPPAKTPVICKGARGYPYVGTRCINTATGKMLDDFYVPVAYGGRNQYKKPVVWCPIPTTEKVVNDD